jgi:hypothetical protein
VPSEQRSYEVCGSEDVEAAGEDGAGETVRDGEDPGDLWLIDCEMGGGGAVLALGDEDLVAVFGGELFCRCGCGSVLSLVRILVLESVICTASVSKPRWRWEQRTSS